MKRMFWLLAGCIALGQVLAQDTRFTYLGVLNDDLAVGAERYDFEVRLFDGPGLNAAELALPVAISGVLPQSGAFTLELDFGASAFDGTERWLEIAVSAADAGQFEVLEPRQRIAAVPVAMHSDTTTWDGIAGMPADIADGDSDSLGVLSSLCQSGQAALFDTNTGSWACGDPPPGPQGETGPQGSTGPAGAPGPIGNLNCSAGQIARFDGQDWVCAADGEVAGLPQCPQTKMADGGAVAGDLLAIETGQDFIRASGFRVELEGPLASNPPQFDGSWRAWSEGTVEQGYSLCSDQGQPSWVLDGSKRNVPLRLADEVSDYSQAAKAAPGDPRRLCFTNNYRVGIEGLQLPGGPIDVQIDDLEWASGGRMPVRVTMTFLHIDDILALQAWQEQTTVNRAITVTMLDTLLVPMAEYKFPSCTLIEFDGLGLDFQTTLDAIASFRLTTLCSAPDINHVMPLLLSQQTDNRQTGTGLTITQLNSDGTDSSYIRAFSDVYPVRFMFPKFDANSDDVRCAFEAQIGFGASSYP